MQVMDLWDNHLRQIPSRTYLNHYYILASNAYVLHMHESPHFHHHGNGCFLLVEALPQSPQNTRDVFWKCWKKSSSYAIVNRCDTQYFLAIKISGRSLFGESIHKFKSRQKSDWGLVSWLCKTVSTQYSVGIVLALGLDSGYMVYISTLYMHWTNKTIGLPNCMPFHLNNLR